MGQDASTGAHGPFEDACLDETVLLACQRVGADDALRPEAWTHLEGCTPCREAVIAMGLARPETAAEESRYLLVRCLGGGGMGAVFEAWDRALGRHVALKFLHDGGATPAARVRTEARALAQLSHPHVVAVFGLERVDGELCLAMERMSGGTLQQWLGTSPPVELVLKRFVDAGEGLAAIHEAGLVHRDFKADNVLLGDEGRVVVADFGFARGPRQSPLQTYRETTRDTTDDTGTPAFARLAPELRRDGSATAASDQYAFGASLRAALPEGGSAQLRVVLRRMMAESPTERYASMPAALAALRQPSQRRRGHRRGWLAVVAWGLGLAALVAGTAAWLATPSGQGVPALYGGVGWAAAWEVRFVVADTKLPVIDTAAARTELLALGQSATAVSDAARHARAKLRLCVASVVLGDAKDVAAVCQDAVVAAESVGIENNTVIEAWVRWAGLSIQSGEFSKAADALQSARAFAARHESVSDAARALIARSSGDVARAKGAYDDAVGAYEEALDWGRQPSIARAVTFVSLGHAHFRLGNVAEADEAGTAALRILDEVAPEGPTRLGALGLLGRVATEQGEFERADALQTEVVEVLRARAADDDLQLAIALNTRGATRTERGRFDLAREDLETALLMYERILGADAPTTGNALYAIGTLELRGARFDEARAALSRSLDLARRSGNAHFVASVQVGLCEAERGLRREGAGDLCRDAYAALAEVLPPGHPHLVEAAALLTAESAR